MFLTHFIVVAAVCILRCAGFLICLSSEAFHGKRALVLTAYSLISKNSLCSEMKRQGIITTMGERSERIYSLILVH